MEAKIQAAPSCVDLFDSESISLDEALQRIAARVQPVNDLEKLPLRDCLGRINAADVVSPLNIPPNANSAMDGFAVALDTIKPEGLTELKVTGTAFAGIPCDTRPQPGECIRIMTGAILPDGVDTVIMQEQVNVLDDNTIQVDADHRPGENIRRAGEDISEGQVILEAGIKISPADLGVIASLGIGELSVYRKPVVAFFSTGDELVSIGEALEDGKIYDSNRYSLFGLLSRLPVDILDLGVIRDNPDDIRDALGKAAEQADLILTTGGVSVGEADYIKDVLEELGDTEFWKIAIKPGRPLTLGSIGNSHFLGLPGNPVAVMVTFSQFVVPAIQRLSGALMQPPRLFDATSKDSLRKKPGRTEFQRGIAEQDGQGNWTVSKTGKQGSGILTSMSRANCFIVLPPEQANVEPGDTVHIQFFDWFITQF